MSIVQSPLSDFLHSLNYIFEKIEDPAGKAEFVVIPGQDFYKISIDYRSTEAIHNGRCRISDIIHRDKGCLRIIENPFQI